MNKNSIYRYLRTALLASLFLANNCFSAELDFTNSDDLEIAASNAMQIPKPEDYLLFMLMQVIDKHYIQALQYLILKGEGAIKYKNNRPYVDPILIKTFYEEPKSKQTIRRLYVLAKAYSSPVFQSKVITSQFVQKEFLPSPELLNNLADVLDFGINVQLELNNEVDKISAGFGWPNTSLLELLGYWVGPPLANFLEKSYIALMLNSAYKCNANALLYNSVPFLSSEATTQQTSRLIHFLQGCKVEKSEDNPNQNILQTMLEKHQPLAAGLQQHAKNHGLELIPPIDSINFETPRIGLYDVIASARLFEGALHLVVFTGQAKYQYGVFGVFRNRLNFAFVADDNEPTPILNFSVPLSDLDVNTLVDGISSLMNGKANNPRNAMDKVDSIWLIKSR